MHPHSMSTGDSFPANKAPGAWSWPITFSATTWQESSWARDKFIGKSQAFPTMSVHVVLWPYGKKGWVCVGVLSAFGDDGVSGGWRKLLREVLRNV